MTITSQLFSFAAARMACDGERFSTCRISQGTPAALAFFATFSKMIAASLATNAGRLRFAARTRGSSRQKRAKAVWRVVRAVAMPPSLILTPAPGRLRGIFYVLRSKCAQLGHFTIAANIATIASC